MTMARSQYGPAAWSSGRASVRRSSSIRLPLTILSLQVLAMACTAPPDGGVKPRDASEAPAQ